WSSDVCSSDLVHGADAHVELLGQFAKAHILLVMALQPDLNLQNRLIPVLVGAAFEVAHAFISAANFVGKMSLHVMGNLIAIKPLDEMHGEVRKGVDAGGAVELVRLG